jgi:hypothetical protein
MTAPQVHARVDSKTGAVDRWVAGSCSSKRYVFLAHIRDAQLTVGEVTTLELYALLRARSNDPLAEYQFSRRVPTGSSGKLAPKSSTTSFAPLEPTRQELLLDNAEVVDALVRIYGERLRERLSVARRATGSVFFGAYVARQAELSADKANQRSEVETRIYCRGHEDLRLHSLYRVSAPRD